MKLANVNFEEFGYKVSSASGYYDMPARLQPHYYDWGSSIEPLVDDAFIHFENYVLTVKFIRDERIAPLDVTREVFLEGMGDIFENYKIDVSESDGTVGVFLVDTKSITDVKDYEGAQTLVIEMATKKSEFLQPVPAPNSSLDQTYSIDGIAQEQFGLTMGKMTGLKWRPDKKVSKQTSFNRGTIYGRYREVKKISIECMIIGESPQDAFLKLESFKSLLAKPGFRNLKHNGNELTVYHTDGFKTTKVGRNAFKFNLRLNQHDSI